MANFIIDRGASWSVEVEINDDTGANLNLTGATAAAEIKTKHYDRLSIPVTPAFMVPRTDGKLLLSLTPSETPSVPLGRLSEMVCTVTFSAADVREYVLGDVEGV